MGDEISTEWKRIRNIRKDSYRKEKGTEAWVPLAEVTEDRDKLLEIIRKLKSGIMLKVSVPAPEGYREIEAIRVFPLNTPKYGLRFCVEKPNDKREYFAPKEIRMVEVIEKSEPKKK